MALRSFICVALVLLCLPACSPRSGPAKRKAEGKKVFEPDYKAIPPKVEAMLPRIRAHVRALADLGPRQTGQAGCDGVRDYVLGQMREFLPNIKAERIEAPVTVPLDRTEKVQLESVDDAFTHLVVKGVAAESQRWPAHAFYPNCAQACVTHPASKCPLKKERKGEACLNCEKPRRLVDLRHGDWDDLKGKDLSDAVALFDFNSGDAWLRAASLGAAGAVFIEPEETTLFQADRKYLATLPLHFPRLYVSRERGVRLREAIAKGDEVRVTLANRLRFKNVSGECFSFVIPGKDRGHCFAFAAHYDARCIVPDLAYGSAELWGVAELLEISRHFAEEQPPCDVRIMFMSGHWQSQIPMREFLARNAPDQGDKKLGSYFRGAIGIDLVPEGKSLNLIAESAWEPLSGEAYKWLGRLLMQEGGWRDRMMEGLEIDRKEVGLYAGARPVVNRSGDHALALRNDRCPAVFAPRFTTAETPWNSMRLTAFAFQTARLARLRHNTPLDRLPDEGLGDVAAIDEQLRPQLQLTLVTIEHLLNVPVSRMPSLHPVQRSIRANWGGYAHLSGNIQIRDRSIGWFSEKLPEGKEGNALQTFVQAYPVNNIYTTKAGGRLRNRLNWPVNPSKGKHRGLQSFMFQDMQMLRNRNYYFPMIYTGIPSARYNMAAYAVDEAGHLRYATDYGIHGDGNPSFQCTDLEINRWDLKIPVTLFECGSLELFDLVDPQRRSPDHWVYGQYLHAYNYGAHHGDLAVPVFLGIAGVKDVDSHTDADRWGYAQYGPTAMVFLPSNTTFGLEVLLGAWHRNFAVLADRGEDGKPRGYSVEPGQVIRPARDHSPGPLTCVRQLERLNEDRLMRFSEHDVSSPLAKKNHSESVAAIREGEKAHNDKDWRKAFASYRRGWMLESKAYLSVMGLLLDVVSTTVLYFVLLIPFSFMVERLIFPQRTVLGAAVVSVLVFSVFALILYLFHPGFQLAHNVMVTVIAFVIVVMTIPALILLLVRGVAMLKAIGSKSVITQQSEAESAGVVMAALSLAVSNMRQRPLRTAMTLSTITALVMALVLLTTSAAFDFKILDPADTGQAGFEGIQVFNATDRRLALLTEGAELFEDLLRDEALVIPRETINYGYDRKLKHGAIVLEANGQQTPVSYLQVMDHRDNLPEYTLHEGEKTRKVHLSDLMKGGFLAEGDVDACLIPNTMAEALQVDVGDTVTVMGMALKVKGIWIAREEVTDAEGKTVFVPGPLDKLADLDGSPITAMHSARFKEAEPDNPIHAPSHEMIIVSRTWVNRQAVFPRNIFSLVVIPNGSDKDPDLIESVAARISREMMNVDVFTHYVDRETGVSKARRISMLTATHVKGSSMMFVITGVAVLMILSIMTGTVHERMKEIHIFSSVGLAPGHVAGMFLVEALVYAGIASVLGYFLGMVALKVLLGYLKDTGQAQEFYPNYLGVYVLYSIGIAVATTVTSSLYPIRLASRIVNPSEGKSWETDAEGDDDRLTIRLPFIATTWEEARSMMVYAYDFLAMHQGERSGRFVCEEAPAGRTVERTAGLAVPVWLAPFERDLTQRVELNVTRQPGDPWWEMGLKLQRNSGPAYLWRRGTRVFVNMLIKHLLRWRAATAQQEEDCLKRAEELFPVQEPS